MKQSLGVCQRHLRSEPEGDLGRANFFLGTHTGLRKMTVPEDTLSEAARFVGPRLFLLLSTAHKPTIRRSYGRQHRDWHTVKV